MDNLVVWAADIGSISNHRFGWCRATYGQPETGGTDIHAFASGIATDIMRGYPVAIGFECPLFVPIAADPRWLTRARVGEGNRAWSAGAGAGALATGLTQCVWIFEQLRLHTDCLVTPTFAWDRFRTTEANVFIWEAFVSGTAKGQLHTDDAAIAVRAFWSAYPAIGTATAIQAENPYSLVGAALLRAGLSTDLTILSLPCIVIKAS